MSAGHNAIRPPGGLSLMLFRAPIFLYRIGLGWLLGKRFTLINHVGRRSGKAYQTVVEVVARDAASGALTVVSAWGEQTQWYQNLRASPETVIQLGSRTIPVRAEFLSPEAGADVVAQYLIRHRTAAQGLVRVMGYQWDGTDADARRIARDYFRLVTFHPRASGE